RSVSAGTRSAMHAEWRKLATQLPLRLLAVVCVVAPFALAVVLAVQSGTPSDALFGVLVHTSGFAISLVVLGFSAAWGFPIVAGGLAGDPFSSRGRRRAAETVLTRRG